MSEPPAEEGGGDGGSASDASFLRSHASIRAFPEESGTAGVSRSERPEHSGLEAHLHGSAKDLSVRRPLSTPSAASEPAGRTRAASSEKLPCSDTVSLIGQRSTEASAFSRSPERDKVTNSLTIESQRKWQPEAQDRDRVGCIEEMVAQINAKLQAREEDIAKLRNEIHTVRPTALAGEADVTDAAAVEDMRGAFSDLLQEQAKRQDEALAMHAARLAVLEQQTRDQLSSNTSLSCRLGLLEAELKEGAARSPAESKSKERLEAVSHKDDFGSPGIVRRAGSLSSLVVPPSILEEEEPSEDRSPSALTLPRMSIVRGHELRREKTMPALTQPQFKSPPVRRSVKDLAEVMRSRRESCEEWSSSGQLQLAAALATSTSPSPVSGASKAVASPGDAASGSEDQSLEKGSPAHDVAPSTRPQSRGQPEASAREDVTTAKDQWLLPKASSMLDAVQNSRPQPPGQSEERCRDSAEIAALLKRVEVIEHTVEGQRNSQIERLGLIEGHVQAGEQRLQDLQAGLAMEIRALVKDLLQALPPPEEQNQQSQQEAEKAAVQAQLEIEQARLTQEASALTKRMSLLETQVQESLGELRQGHSTEPSALRQTIDAPAGDRQPPECSEDKPAEVPCDSRDIPPSALPVPPSALPEPGEGVEKEAGAADSYLADHKEFQRHAEGSNSRIEELMKKLLAEQQSSGTEDKEAAGETNTVFCSELQDPSCDLSDETRGLGEEQSAGGALPAHSSEKNPELGVRELPQLGVRELSEAAPSVQPASDPLTQLAGATADDRCAISSSVAADAQPQGRRDALLDESCGVEHAAEGGVPRHGTASADVVEAMPHNGNLDHLEARVSELERRAQQLAGGGETTGPISEVLAEVRGKVEALVRQQSQASSKAEEQQESLEALQGQVGALEQCLEVNDGKLSEIQTTFATAKIEGLVKIDERVKALEGCAKAPSQGSPVISDSASFGERLSVVEQRVQEADGGIRRVQEEQRSEVCWLRRHFQQLEALMSPRFSHRTMRRQNTEDRQPEVQAESLAAALDPSVSEDLSVEERVKALQRYVDDRLRKLKNAQEEQMADTTELQRRFDAQSQGQLQREVSLSSPTASPTSQVDTFGVDTTDVSERLRTLEGKCATMLEMILRL